MAKTSGAQFQLTQDSYLRMKGGDPTPVYLHAGTVVGADTPFDFDGPPNLAMLPLNDAAQALADDAVASAPHVDYSRVGATSVKNTPEPAAGGEAPFDPADPAGPATPGAGAPAPKPDAKADQSASPQKPADPKKS